MGKNTDPHLGPFDLPLIPLAFIPPPFGLKIVEDRSKRHVLAIGRGRGSPSPILRAKLALLALVLLLLKAVLLLLGKEVLLVHRVLLHRLLTAAHHGRWHIMSEHDNALPRNTIYKSREVVVVLCDALNDAQPHFVLVCPIFCVHFHFWTHVLLH